MRKISIPVIILLVLCAGSNFALDQWTKALARQELIGKAPQDYFGGLMTLVYAENDGAFLSAFGRLDQPFKDIILIWIPLLATVAGFSWMIFSKKLGLPERFVLSCIIGGGFANLLDRLLYGHVTDFLNFGIGSVRTGILNVADLSLTFGAITLFILMWRKERRQKKTEPNKDPASK